MLKALAAATALKEVTASRQELLDLTLVLAAVLAANSGYSRDEFLAKAEECYAVMSSELGQNMLAEVAQLTGVEL